MKKCLPIAVLSGILILFSLSCKKSQPAADYSDAIIGSWVLRYSEGGLLTPSTTRPTGGLHIISFTHTDYSVFLSSFLLDSGHYTLVQDNRVREATCNPSLEPDQFEKLTYIHSSYSTDVYIRITGDLLEIYSGCEAADGTYEKYERVPRLPGRP
jgi:hypothetical protein